MCIRDRQVARPLEIQRAGLGYVGHHTDGRDQQRRRNRHPFASGAIEVLVVQTILAGHERRSIEASPRVATLAGRQAGAAGQQRLVQPGLTDLRERLRVVVLKRVAHVREPDVRARGDHTVVEARHDKARQVAAERAAALAVETQQATEVGQGREDFREFVVALRERLDEPRHLLALLAVLALGAVFSALEVVPLVLIGFEAYENLTLAKARPWVAAYLVLVCGVAQCLFGVIRRYVAPAPISAVGFAVELVCWNAGNAAVVVGDLLRILFLVGMGGALLVVVLMRQLVHLRHVVPGLRWAAWLYGVVVAVLMVPMLLIGAYRLLPKTRFGQHVILAGPVRERGDAIADGPELIKLLGQVGEVLTPLRPVGTCRFDGRRVECVAETGYVQKGATVKVIRVEGTQLTVRVTDEA